MSGFVIKTGVLTLFAFWLVPASWTQAGPSLNGKSSDQTAPDKSSAAAPAVAPDVEAYKEFYEARGHDPAQLIHLGEDYLAKYPTSHFAGAVYAELATIYLESGNTDKFMADAAKTLELNPDSIDVLPLLAMVIPRRVKVNQPDAAQQLQQAQTYANHAIDLLGSLAKPPQLDDVQFQKIKNDKLALCHSGLGAVAIKEKKYPVAVTELKQATELANTPDPVDLFLLGAADDATSHFTGAVAAFTKCADNGPMQPQCKAGIEQAKKDSQNRVDVPE